MAMWCNWKARFEEFGADRIDFKTSKKGGAQAGKMVSRAKCLLFFNCNDSDKAEFEKRFSLDYIAGKILCGEKIAATLLAEENFGYQVKDWVKGDYYGTKVGYPILEFTPAGVHESRGKERRKPGLIISRVFKLGRHREIDKTGICRRTFSFRRTDGIVFVAYLRGRY